VTDKPSGYAPLQTPCAEVEQDFRLAHNVVSMCSARHRVALGGEGRMNYLPNATARGSVGGLDDEIH